MLKLYDDLGKLASRSLYPFVGVFQCNRLGQALAIGNLRRTYMENIAFQRSQRALQIIVAGTAQNGLAGLGISSDVQTREVPAYRPKAMGQSFDIVLGLGLNGDFHEPIGFASHGCKIDLQSTGWKPWAAGGPTALALSRLIEPRTSSVQRGIVGFQV
jgi:hypothetical protein